MDFPDLIKIKATKKYELLLVYSDGTEGLLDLGHLANMGVFQYWERGDNFFHVCINPEMGGIAWSEDLDICPNAAYLTLKRLTFEEWKAQNSSYAPA